MSTSLSFGKFDVLGYLDSCVSKTRDLWIQGFQSPENSGLLFLRFRAPTISRFREMNSCTTQPRDFGSLWFQYYMAFRFSRIISFHCTVLEKSIFKVLRISRFQIVSIASSRDFRIRVIEFSISLNPMNCEFQIVRNPIPRQSNNLRYQKLSMLRS